MEDNSKIHPKAAWFKVSLISFASRLKSTYEDTTEWRCGSSYHLADSGDLVQIERLTGMYTWASDPRIRSHIPPFRVWR